MGTMEDMFVYCIMVMIIAFILAVMIGIGAVVVGWLIDFFY